MVLLILQSATKSRVTVPQRAFLACCQFRKGKWSFPSPPPLTMLYCCMSYLPETPQLWTGIVLFSKVPKFVDSILTISLTAFTLGKVPEYGTHRVLILMWTHVFFNYPCCNKVTVPGCLSSRSRPCTQAQQWAPGSCVHTNVISYNANHCFILLTKFRI